MTPSTDSVILEIVHALDEQGIDENTYTLHDYVDIDALTRVVDSADDSIEVRLTIEGVQFTITQDGVRTQS